MHSLRRHQISLLSGLYVGVRTKVPEKFVQLSLKGWSMAKEKDTFYLLNRKVKQTQLSGYILGLLFQSAQPPSCFLRVSHFPNKLLLIIKLTAQSCEISKGFLNRLAFAPLLPSHPLFTSSERERKRFGIGPVCLLACRWIA